MQLVIAITFITKKKRKKKEHGNKKTFDCSHAFVRFQIVLLLLTGQSQLAISPCFNFHFSATFPPVIPYQIIQKNETS